MSNYPEYMFLAPNGADLPLRFPGFPYRLALVPNEYSLAVLRASPRCWAMFLIEPSCAAEVLNGVALGEYLTGGVPVVLHARRARDLRPFLRRAGAFKRRGYSAQVMEGGAA